jgi:DNA-binding transcriptional MerR regulator
MTVALERDDRPRHLFTAAEAARRLGINPARIRVWAFRKLLYAYGIDERGRPMYDRDDLIALRDRGVPGKGTTRKNRRKS